MGSRARPVVLVVLSVLLVFAGLAVSGALNGGDGETGSPMPPTARDLDRLGGRVFDAGLERHGIFVVDGGIEGSGGSRCFRVGLLNPTRANVEYLRRRFGRALCPAREPSGIAQVGVGCGLGPSASEGRVVEVPDVRGLQPFSAGRRLRAAGLLTCNGPERAPGRFDAENALRVRSQCPAAGSRVVTPAYVFTRSDGRLPGGFMISDSAEDGRCPGR